MSQGSPPVRDDRYNDIPGWLRRMRGWQETPEWLRRFIQQQEDTSPAAELRGSLEELGFQAPVEPVAFEATPPGEEHIPEWLEGAEEELAAEVAPFADQTPAAPEAEFTSWLMGAEAEESEEVGPERRPDEEEPSAARWLMGFGERPPAGEQEPEADEEELPEWLRGAEQVGAEPTPAVEGAPAKREGGYTEWLMDLESEGPSEAGMESEPPKEVPLSGEEELPEWLQGAEQVGAGPASTAEGAPAEREGGYTDWLMGLEEAGPSETEEEPEGPEELPLAAETEAEGEAERPDWLGRAEEERPETTLERPLFGEEELPDWLQAMQAEPPAARGAEAELPSEEEPAEAAHEAPIPSGEELPEWLRAMEEEPAEAAPEAPIPGEEELPEWLQAVEEEPAEAPPEAPIPGEEELPEWLQAVEEEPAEAAPEAPIPGGEELPEWLRAMEEEPAEAAPEAPISGEEELPEWLRAIEEAPAAQEVPLGEREAISEGEREAISEGEEEAEGLEAAMPDWVREVAEEEGLAEPSFEISEPEEMAPGTPEWMAELYAEREAMAQEMGLGLSEEDLAPLTEVPEWVEELRAEGAAEVDQDLPLQTSGPLAGLRGVLTPEPLLGIFPESTYRPTPPVPESQIAEARLVEQALSVPLGRPVPMVASSAKTVIAGLWRWLMYAALAIVIIVVAFLPGLQAAVRPPTMPEARALYYQVDGMPARSKVLLVFDYDAGLDGELTPQARAISWHLLSKGDGILTVGLSPQGTAIAQDLFAGMNGVIYGEHYVDLGYLPPHPASLQAFVIDPFAGRMLTGGGTDPAQTPLGQRVSSFEDLDLVILISGSQDHVRWWIEQVDTQHDVPTVAGLSAAIAPYVRPYYDEMGTGQLRGILTGLAGAAEYEELSGVDFWPNARQNLSLQGYAQIVLAGIVLLGGARGLLSFLGRPIKSHPQT